MSTGESSDTSYIRVFFRAYAISCGCGRSRTHARMGPLWFGTELVTRVFGRVLAVLACWALALSLIEDPGVRRTGTGWFAVAHFVVLQLLHDERRVIWGPNNAERSGDVLQVVWCTVIMTMCEFWAVTNKPFWRRSFLGGNTPGARGF